MMQTSNIRGTNCDQLMNLIDQASFAMDDVLLFLDTHPGNMAALNYYHQIIRMRREAMDAYQNSCGPLMVDQVRSDQYWTWVEGPWPWEGGKCVCGDMKNVCNIQ